MPDFTDKNTRNLPKPNGVWNGWLGLVVMKKSKVGLIFWLLQLLQVSLVPVNTLADNGKVRHMLYRFSAGCLQQYDTGWNYPWFAVSWHGAYWPGETHGFETSGKFEVYSVMETAWYIVIPSGGHWVMLPETYMVVTVENNVVTRMTGINSVMLQKRRYFPAESLKKNNLIWGI